MITVEDSIPQRTQNYLLGQDVLWTQFNEVNFYVEDIDQENFYFQVLKKIFSNIKFDRIFPLGGKKNVIDEANNSLEERNKVFILDLDFDEILCQKKNISNVFYLRKYSIENYLIEKSAIHELIREEFVKISDSEIEKKFNLNKFLVDSKNALQELAAYFLIIKKHNLNIKYIKLSPRRDCFINDGTMCIKEEVLVHFYQKVEHDLKSKDGRLTISAQIRITKRNFKNLKSASDNIPGKYILNLLKYEIERSFSIKQIPSDSFVYRLAKNCTLNSLKFLKESVTNYVSGHTI